MGKWKYITFCIEKFLNIIQREYINNENIFNMKVNLFVTLTVIQYLQVKFLLCIFCFLNTTVILTRKLRAPGKKGGKLLKEFQPWQHR